jgi:hypothetical protein
MRLERMADSLQLCFTDYEQIYARKMTRRQRFLDKMESTVPWESGLIQSFSTGSDRVGALPPPATP